MLKIIDVLPDLTANKISEILPFTATLLRTDSGKDLFVLSVCLWLVMSQIGSATFVGRQWQLNILGTDVMPECAC
jgi:hypothetical protein